MSGRVGNSAGPTSPQDLSDMVGGKPIDAPSNGYRELTDMACTTAAAGGAALPKWADNLAFGTMMGVPAVLCLAALVSALGKRIASKQD